MIVVGEKGREALVDAYAIILYMDKLPCTLMYL